MKRLVEINLKREENKDKVKRFITWKIKWDCCVHNDLWFCHLSLHFGEMVFDGKFNYDFYIFREADEAMFSVSHRPLSFAQSPIFWCCFNLSSSFLYYFFHDWTAPRWDANICSQVALIKQRKEDAREGKFEIYFIVTVGRQGFSLSPRLVHPTHKLP